MYDILAPNFPANETNDAYPNGDAFIPINELGCLLLFVHNVSRSPDTQYLYDDAPNQSPLDIHRRLVSRFLDDATRNVVDAVLFLGIVYEQHIKPDYAFPSFTEPHDAQTTEFLEYIQVLPLRRMMLM